MLSKTSLNKMKKDELVEYILKGQEKAGRDALFAEEDENAELQRKNKNIEWDVDDAERRASGILSYWSNENKIIKEGLTSNLSEYNTLKQKYDALEQEFKWRLSDECQVAIVETAFDEQWEVVKRRTHVDLLHRSCVEMEALKEQNKELREQITQARADTAGANCQIDAMVENYENIFDRLREYMGRIDGNCVEVFDEIVDDGADE